MNFFDDVTAKPDQFTLCSATENLCPAAAWAEARPDVVAGTIGPPGFAMFAAPTRWVATRPVAAVRALAAPGSTARPAAPISVAAPKAVARNRLDSI